MALLIDTDEVDTDARAERLRDVLLDYSGSSRVDLSHDGGAPTGRVHLSPLGDAAVFVASTSGVRLLRDRESARQGLDDVVAIAVHGVGTGRHETPGHRRLVRGGELMMVDVTRPFCFAWDGAGSSAALQVPRGALGMSVDLVQEVCHRLQSSTLHHLVARHIADTARTARDWDATETGAVLGAASIQLVRALLADVSDDPRLAASAAEDTLAVQVLEHVRQNVRDPDLGPDRIAAALAVSRRQLFRACARAEVSIEQHIIDLRLKGACGDLRDPRLASRSIASIASAWGFRSVDHFHRRFRRAYGVTPGEWRGSLDGG